MAKKERVALTPPQNPITNANGTRTTDADRAEYLRKVSQCIYNIKTATDIHFMEHVREDKDLHNYYEEEIIKLNDLLETPVGAPVISVSDITLSGDMVFITNISKPAQEEIDNTYDFLRIALHKVQRERKFGSTRPTTGLEDGPFKDLLMEILAEKQEYNKESKKLRVELIGGNQLATNENNHAENQDHDNIVLNSDNSNIDSKVVSGKRILINGRTRISLGSIGNIPSKFWEFPSPIGSPKTVESTFLATNPTTSKFTGSFATTLTKEDKEEILKTRFKELQRKTSKKGLKLSLVFNNINPHNPTVYINLK